MAHALGNGLGDFNAAAGFNTASRPVWLLARRPDGALRGGIKAEVKLGWFYVDWLWVEEAERRQGLGAQLLTVAEEEARRRNCAGIHLHTWSFQAPDFYRRQGFQEAGRLEGFPPGGAQYWFVKHF
jgi:GNAT superfamily N-acetyltransferase